MKEKSVLFTFAIIWYGMFGHVKSFHGTSFSATKRVSLFNRHVAISHLPDNDEWTNLGDFTVMDLDAYASKDQLSTTNSTLSPFQSAWTKYAMIAYIAHMCVALPLVLFPTHLKNQIMIRLGLLTKSASEHEALQVSQNCARTLLQLIPFMNLTVTPHVENKDPVPTIWVSNHVSMLDTFVFLSSDEELRGKKRRPLKTIYWKGLDANPICKLVFSMAGFISVDMANNGNGNPNEYKKESFKKMLKDTKRAIEEGFDIFILPEGQLNPTPEQGLQPVLPGAFALAKSSNRPIQMIGLYGCHHLWHADDRIGMRVVGKDVEVRAFPPCERQFGSAEEFTDAFNAIVGTFAKGQEVSRKELDDWLT